MISSKTLLAVSFSLFLLCSCSHAKVTSYGGSHISPPSQYYNVMVNGEHIYVHSFGNKGYAHHIAHFGFDGTAEIEVTYNEKVIKDKLNISPHRLKIDPVVKGNKFSFSLSQPRKLIISVNAAIVRYPNWRNLDEYQLLFILAEEYDKTAPKPGGPGVINAADYNSAQAAVDACAKGQTVYFPSGTYSGFSLPRGNITLYLVPGAFIKKEDQDVISFEHKDNVTIKGRGVIQGDGCPFQPKYSDYLTLEGVIIRNEYKGPPGNNWTFTPVKCHNAVIKNAKLFSHLKNDPPRGPPSAFQPQCCSNMLVENSLGVSYDNGIAIKVGGWMNIGPPEPTSNVTFRNNIIWSMTGGYKIGTEIYADIENFTFENNDIVMGGGNDDLFNRQRGTKFKNIRYINNRVENNKLAFLSIGSLYREPDIYPFKGEMDVTFDNHVVEKIWRNDPGYKGLWAYATPDSKVKVTFNNLRVEGKLIGSLQDLKDLGLKYMKIENVDIVFNTGCYETP